MTIPTWVKKGLAGIGAFVIADKVMDMMGVQANGLENLVGYGASYLAGGPYGIAGAFIVQNIPAIGVIQKKAPATTFEDKI